MSKIEIQDWGLIDYQIAWDRQKELVKDIQANRNKNVLVICEHPTVITIGKTGSQSNILYTKEILKSNGVQVIENNRGGDVTLHNPGQIIAYPIFNLSDFKEDLHWFLREIEECIIELITEYGIKSSRVKGLTGVWVDKKRKICAMGLNCSRWVTSHGLALNVNNNLKEFDYIIPCGIRDKQVSSMSAEIGTELAMSEVKRTLINRFKEHF